MAKTIWKFELEIVDQQTLVMPVLANILSVAPQKDKLCMWALVDPYSSRCDFIIRIHGTGNPLPTDGRSPGRFLGTAVMDPFVWHVFFVGHGTGGSS